MAVIRRTAKRVFNMCRVYCLIFFLVLFEPRFSIANQRSCDLVKADLQQFMKLQPSEYLNQPGEAGKKCPYIL